MRHAITRRHLLSTGSASLAAMMMPAASRAQSNTIRFIVGAAAGGTIDVYSRVIAEHMGRTLARNIVIEARPGAGGTIATQWVKDQPADGANIWVGTAAMTEINPHVFPNQRWSLDDFTPLIKGIDAPLVFVVHPSVPARTLEEFVAWVKKNPGKLSYASYTPGTPGHFLSVQMNEKFGLDLQHVPYRGSAPQVTDLVAGHALLGFAQIQSVQAHVESGSLIPLGTTGEKRFFTLPNVPTFAELGHPELTASIWFGLLVKKGTPKEIVDAYLSAARAAHKDPAVQETLRKQGLEPAGIETEEFEKQIKAGSARWERIVKATGFKVSQ